MKYIDDIVNTISVLPIGRFICWLLFFASLFYGLLKFALQIIHKLIRAKTIRKVGCPPFYCDGDGDMNKEAGTTDDKGIIPVTK